MLKAGTFLPHRQILPYALKVQICYHQKYRQQQKVPRLAVMLAVLADGRKLQSCITLKDNAKGEAATRCHLQISGEGMDDIVINLRLLLGCLKLVKLVPY